MQVSEARTALVGAWRLVSYADRSVVEEPWASRSATTLEGWSSATARRQESSTSRQQAGGVKNSRLAVTAREGDPSTLEEELRGEGGDRTSSERQTYRRSDLREASPLR